MLTVANRSAAPPVKEDLTYHNYPAPSPTPEQSAIRTAQAALCRTHSTYIPDKIKATRVTAVGLGFEVRLDYRTRAGSLLRYVCQVREQTATCYKAAAN